jgi:hypothetical protein
MEDQPGDAAPGVAFKLDLRIGDLEDAPFLVLRKGFDARLAGGFEER